MTTLQNIVLVCMLVSAGVGAVQSFQNPRLASTVTNDDANVDSQSMLYLTAPTKAELIETLRELAAKPDGNKTLILVGYKGDDGDIHMLTAADLRCH